MTGDFGRSLSFTPDAISNFPKILGEVDPMRVLQSMPGIVTNSDSNAGLYIHGFEDSHNICTLAGAPAYICPRLLGFLPVLTASARQSFLNQVYKGALKFESSQIGYSFTYERQSLHNTSHLPQRPSEAQLLQVLHMG